MRKLIFGLSLRVRIWLFFTFVIGFGVAGASLVFLQQEQTSKMSSRIAVESRNQVMLGIRITDALSTLEQKVRGGANADWEAAEFQRLLDSFETRLSSEDARALLQRIEFKFKTYQKVIRSSDRGGLIRGAYYQDLFNDVTHLIALSSNLNLHDLHKLTEDQEVISRVAMYSLMIFILFTVIGGYFAIENLTRPLSNLAGMLDRMNVESDLPTTMPKIGSKIPEISRVAKSFEQVLQRLRGYRALNVRRLLIEKRRADIIAASISDGIFLLRGEQILYMNPVGERILGRSIGGLGSGLGMEDLRELALHDPVDISPELPFPKSKSIASDSAETARSEFKSQTTRCAETILMATSQTLPVEFILEDGTNRKLFYLFQAYPISYDLIEQVEHGVGGPVDQLLDRFQATTLVVAQDVTLVRESQEAKGHFLATLSHEIKTPVTSLTMATRLLSKKVEEIPDPTHRQLIRTCAEDVDRLRRLLDDLLNISRFDVLNQRLELQSLDLIKFLRNTLHSFRPEASDRGVSVVFSVASSGQQAVPTQLMMTFDPSKVAWAVSNLILNALRHSPRGDRVEIQVICSSEDWVEVRIRDHGPGIDRNRQNRIFDKFSPFYDIRVARSGSAGAGLSIAREIVVAHGGRIWVNSEPGNGAEFCFTLPLRPLTPSGSGSDKSGDRKAGDENQAAGPIEASSSSWGFDRVFGQGVLMNLGQTASVQQVLKGPKGQMSETGQMGQKSKEGVVSGAIARS